MRKIYLTLALIIGFGWSYAQNNQLPVLKKESTQFTKAEMEQKANSVRKYISNRDASSSKATLSRWYGFAFAIDDKLGNIATAGANNIWPDTTVLVNYGSSGYSGPWIHAIGECINPVSDWFDPAVPTDLDINKYMSYSVDSINFYGFYNRTAAHSSAVDTIAIQLLANGDGNYQWNQSNNPWVMTDYGTDTLLFKGIKHASLINYSTSSIYTTIKFPLTAGMQNDTLSNGVNFFQIPVNLQVPAGQVFVASIRFIPGYTWTANVDTIDNLNSLRFISYEENGDGGGSGTLPSYTKRDWNCSYILSQQSMYNAASAVFMPSYGYTAPFGYEHHWLEFLLTSNQTSIATSSASNLSVSQNQPNPFNGTTTIEYSINTKANVMLNVYNVAGAKVLTIDEGTKAAGNYSIKINSSNLKSGVYYYSVNAGDYKITKKMIVY